MITRRLKGSYFGASFYIYHLPSLQYLVFHAVVNHCLNRLIASTILKATYGYSVLSGNDPIVNLLERAATMSGEAGSPGGTSIDLFPFRMFFP